MLLSEANDEFLKGYFSTHDRAKKTREAYRCDLAQFVQFAGSTSELSSVESSVIEQWAARLREEGYNPTSIRRKVVAVRVFCNYWIRKRALSESPFWRVKLSFGRVEHLPRTLTPCEMQSLIAQAYKNYDRLRSSEAESSKPEYRVLRTVALVELLFATGIRVGEASSLNIRDFTVEESVFRVKGKGGFDRLAFIVDKKSLQTLLDHLRVRLRIDTNSEALFLNSFGERLSTQGISNSLDQLRRQAKIERRITPHMLRHTVATLLLRNGADIRIVQDFLGHASIATTQRYTHITKDHLIAALQKFHPSLAFRAATNRSLF